MRRGGLTALEAAGLVTASLSAQAVIRGLLDPGDEVLWGLLRWVPGGDTGRLALLAGVALVGLACGGWAHTHRNRDRDVPPCAPPPPHRQEP